MLRHSLSRSYSWRNVFTYQSAGAFTLSYRTYQTHVSVTLLTSSFLIARLVSSALIPSTDRKKFVRLDFVSTATTSYNSSIFDSHKFTTVWNNLAYMCAFYHEIVWNTSKRISKKSSVLNLTAVDCCVSHIVCFGKFGKGLRISRIWQDYVRCNIWQ